MRQPVTWLYTPAIRTDLMAKALHSGADCIIYDLEDSVLPARKHEARNALRQHLDGLPPRTTSRDGARNALPRIHVRINADDTNFVDDDIKHIAGHPALSGIRIPKVKDPDETARLLDRLPHSANDDLVITCVLESALGIERAFAIATAHPRVGALTLGEGDLHSQLRLGNESSFTTLRSRVVVAAAAAGLPAPVMSAYLTIADDAGLARSCALGRNLGMHGRSALTPKQLPTIAAAFRPDEGEIARAQRIVAAAEHAERDGIGSLEMPDGQFVDEPIVAEARALLNSLQHDSD